MISLLTLAAWLMFLVAAPPVILALCSRARDAHYAAHWDTGPALPLTDDMTDLARAAGVLKDTQ